MIQNYLRLEKVSNFKCDETEMHREMKKMRSKSFAWIISSEAETFRQHSLISEAFEQK